MSSGEPRQPRMSVYGNEYVRGQSLRSWVRLKGMPNPGRVYTRPDTAHLQGPPTETSSPLSMLYLVDILKFQVDA